MYQTQAYEFKASKNTISISPVTLCGLRALLKVFNSIIWFLFLFQFGFIWRPMVCVGERLLESWGILCSDARTHLSCNVCWIFIFLPIIFQVLVSYLCTQVMQYSFESCDGKSFCSSLLKPWRPVEKDVAVKYFVGGVFMFLWGHNYHPQSPAEISCRQLRQEHLKRNTLMLYFIIYLLFEANGFLQPV